MATFRGPMKRKQPATPVRGVNAKALAALDAIRGQVRVPYSVVPKHQRKRPGWKVTAAGGSNSAIYRDAATQAGLVDLHKQLGLLPAQVLRKLLADFGETLGDRELQADLALIYSRFGLSPALVLRLFLKHYGAGLRAGLASGKIKP